MASADAAAHQAKRHAMAAQAAPPASQTLRQRLEEAVEYVIAYLDALDGDPDVELACEDGGGACEDEGHDSDTEQDWADYG